MKSTKLQEQMFALIEEWQLSGKSQNQFCKDKKLTTVKFRYWLRKYESGKIHLVKIVRPKFKPEDEQIHIAELRYRSNL